MALERIDTMALIEEMFVEQKPEPREESLRRRMIARLFAAFDEKSEQKAAVYLNETNGIPIDKLAVSIQAVIRSHRWPSLPRVGDLWRLAREAAGMGRQQYHSGRYVPAPKTWPPLGQRHGAHYCQFEHLAPGLSLVALPMGEQIAGLLEAGEELGA